ncbi:TetR/AcrR family transcriptional regulator, partial [Streptomyces sp. NPDC127098]|uniref:TetR/AcrR family transcriptional regulator n=1 Tax=Streptomyces sp. NPDC127098 TaxID=3347137 RepID=UPI00364F10D8
CAAAGGGGRAARGARGLTHRAVDEAAGLPPGSTSNRARTRTALLELATRRLAAREAAVLGAGEPLPAGAESGPEAAGAVLAMALHRSISEGADLTRARVELALEATRNLELRAVYGELGRGFRDALAAVLAALGARDPARQARSLAAWCEGVQFRFVAGAESATPPSEAELRTGITELLRGMLAS